MNSLLNPEKIDLLVRLAGQTAELPGDMAEFGVYQGGSAKIIAETVPHKVLHLFDTFAGMPEDDEHPDGQHKKGDFTTTLGEVQSNLAGLNVVYHVGYFPDAAIAGLTFSFVHVDADLYQSTAAAIAYFWPRMVQGGVLLFDDYGWIKCPGVKRAVDEHFETVNRVHSCWIVRDNAKGNA